jgi:hypothetical protein
VQIPTVINIRVSFWLTPGVDVYLFLEGPLARCNQMRPSKWRQVIAPSWSTQFLIIVNATLPAADTPRRELLLCRSEAAMKSLLDSRDPSTSDIETSFAAQRHIYHNCGSALPISFQFNRQA